MKRSRFVLPTCTYPSGPATHHTRIIVQGTTGFRLERRQERLTRKRVCPILGIPSFSLVKWMFTRSAEYTVQYQRAWRVQPAFARPDPSSHALGGRRHQ